jgi:ribosomal protein L2
MRGTGGITSLPFFKNVRKSMAIIPEKLIITSEYLNKLIEHHSKTTVGKVLKRVEICDNKDTLKAQIKEILYEQYRDFQQLLVAFNDGFEISYFEIKNKEK